MTFRALGDLFGNYFMSWYDIHQESQVQSNAFSTQAKSWLQCQDIVGGQGWVYSLRARSIEPANTSLLDACVKVIHIL